MFHHRSKGKGKKGKSSSSSQARSATSAKLFAVMVYLVYIYICPHSLLLYCFSFDIFYCCFCLLGTSSSRLRQEAFLEALHDEGQQEMPEAWLVWPEVLEEPEEHEEPKVGAVQQEALEEPKVGAGEQEAPEELNIVDEVGDQP
jgi:hypothetical protein